MTSLKKGRRKGSFNIGTFLFGAVLLYLLIALILYLTRSRITPYEITPGTIVEDSVYTGVIVRQEKEVKSDRKGYVSYYLEDSSKAGAGRTVCAVSGDKLKEDKKADSKEKKPLTSAQQSVILSNIQNYVKSYSPHYYSSLYALHRQINSASGAVSSNCMAKEIDDTAKHGGDITLIKSPDDGIIVYTIDSLDGLNADQVDSSVFDQKGFSERVIRQGAEVKKNEKLFKVLTDETWSIIFPLNERMGDKLKSVKQVETRIGTMQSTLWADLKIIGSDDEPYGQLTYSSGMLQFAGQRFVSVQLILQNNEGLKLPKSSVTKRRVYVIPGDFVMSDPNTGETGIEVIAQDGSRSFKQLNVFARAQKKGSEVCYIKPEEIAAGTLIGKDNSKETYKIGKKEAVKGVYNINKGYCTFQYIDIAASNDTYYIIDENSAYGPKTYDHIALNAKGLEENRVVH